MPTSTTLISCSGYIAGAAAAVICCNAATIRESTTRHLLMGVREAVEGGNCNGEGTESDYKPPH
jgi:hypothetical protein